MQLVVVPVGHKVMRVLLEDLVVAVAVAVLINIHKVVRLVPQQRVKVTRVVVVLIYLITVVVVVVVPVVLVLQGLVLLPVMVV
tara:strand:+ start:152 stop:400 length:249 start_codon:yes stop_codon:yes gene_type:complete